ncbi:MAG: 50S ribosomal protein L21 [Actinobacteria bacterium HGW-Actinobacteria-1]|jgi:large subunit ribosomal protein L21|nr:MAG: 50S ribosomal protein L21 [Actinobacteria bacterium HGW-Actinobacteria-1]
MYAVVATGGKQSKVETGAVTVFEKLDAAVGEAVTLPALFMADGDNVVYGADAASVTVTGTVVEHFRGDKQIVFKFKKRKGYKVKKGHRQNQTAVLVTDITVGAPKKAAKAAKAEEPVAEVAAEKAPAKKPAAKKAAPKAAPKAEAVAEEKAPVKKPAAKKPAAKKTAPKADKAAE